MPPDPDTADDPSFHLLDAYLHDLHSGRRPDRARLLAEHPELAAALECLEALEELAPPSTDLPPAARDTDKTLDGRQQSPAVATPGLGEVETAAPVLFGNYELVEEIGRGGMGVIYKARQQDLQRTVAVKMILANHLASPHQVERFVAEARAMAKLRHPNIVRIHETGAFQGQHYFVMEYITGPSLAEAIRSGRIGPERAARLVAQVARAVEHLHQQGIVHRDLKPSNILLDEQGQPYVTDFGLVKMLGASNLTTTGAIVGTPAYMAPEQATGRPDQVGPLSDVYALGAILYELLTGRPPFHEETALETLVQVIESEPTRPRLLNPALSRPLETICLKCLDKDPAERYLSAAALAEDLERFLDGDTVEARRTGPVQFLRRWTRREPALVYRLGALGVLMAIVQVNYMVTGRTSRAMHLEVLALLSAWMAASVLCQQWLKRGRRPEVARWAWAVADVSLLTALLALTNNQGGPLLVGYPFLIAAAGLFFQVRLVVFTTIVCELAYVLLVATAPAAEEPTSFHYHVIYMVALAVTGFVVAYQAKRIRVLSRYYERRPLP